MMKFVTVAIVCWVILSDYKSRTQKREKRTIQDLFKVMKDWKTQNRCDIRLFFELRDLLSDDEGNALNAAGLLSEFGWTADQTEKHRSICERAMGSPGLKNPEAPECDFAACLYALAYYGEKIRLS